MAEIIDQKRIQELQDREEKRLEKEIQTLTDKFVKEIDEHVTHKEKEIMTV